MDIFYKQMVQVIYLWQMQQETKPTVANVSQTIAPATATDINITGTNFVSIPTSRIC